ncbi:MAG: ABC transporter permease [Planctomyces sp.]|nr:ABC transporter permease [Planctomyces sp.]
MSIFQIAWKSIRQRSVASFLTGLSVALGVMLMVAVMILYSIIASTFQQTSIGYDLVVGPKGSPLQLVLSSIYRVSPPIENLPFRFYKDLQKDPRVDKAIPIALGDTTEEGSFPIVGTVPEYFSIPFSHNREFAVRGTFLRKPFDAVIGSRVAATNGWKEGSQLRMVHGGADTGHVHNEKFTVVGVLAPTGTPNDRSVFVNLDGFYLIQGHDKPFDEAIKREREFYGQPPLEPEVMAAEVQKLEKRYGGHHDHDHAEGEEHFHDVPMIQKEVTAILVTTKTLMAAGLMEGEFKKGFKAQATNPIRPMNQLLTDILGNIQILLLILTGLIIVVSGVGIFVSIYASLQERRREIAIMRALGARRETIFGIVIAESLLLCLGGGIAGLLLGHLLVVVAAPIVTARTGLLISGFTFQMTEWLLLPGLAVLAVIVGYIPAMSAYRTEVASNLNPS